MAKVYLFGYKAGSKMKKRVSVFDVAKAFLAMESMTHKKLQKLCYYAQAWYLAFEEKKLFNYSFEAWVHGPVCPELYQEYKDCGYFDIPMEKSIPENLTGEKLQFIQEIFNTYGEFTGDQLEALTHSELPWREARKGLEEWMPSHNNINEKTMEDFYYGTYQAQQEE